MATLSPRAKRATQARPAATPRTVAAETEAVGPVLTGDELDARLEKALSGKEKSVSASAAIQSVRRRLKL
jgi:hypothetical protein